EFDGSTPRPLISRIDAAASQAADALLPDAYQRGLRRGKAGMTAATGGMMPETVYGPENDRARAAAHIAAMDRESPRYPPDADVQASLQRPCEAEGFTQAAGELVRNPAVIGDVLLESLGVATPQLAATLAGGAIGGPTTSAVASGAGAFTTEYGQTILDALQDAAGGNLRDVDAVARALGDEGIMSAAKERAVKRGVPIAIFD